MNLSDKLKIMITYGFSLPPLPDQKLRELFQKLVNKFNVDKMSPSEQATFFLEFARVARLRLEKRLAKIIHPPKTTDTLFLEEIEQLSNDLLLKT